jgi:SAM-dependent methyltransferase
MSDSPRRGRNAKSAADTIGIAIADVIVLQSQCGFARVCQMFDSWLRSAVVGLVRDALIQQRRGAAASTPSIDTSMVLVVGDAGLAKALIQAGTAGQAAAISARAAKRINHVVAGTALALELPDAVLTAVVAVAGPSLAIDGQALLQEWTRVVRVGGKVVLVDRGDRLRASMRLLCAGLLEIEQRSSGRTVITSGIVPPAL